ncbi:Annexin A5, partial [Bos mutus]
QVYEEEYGSSLEDDVVGDTSGVFDKYMTISGFHIEETIDRETSGN